MGPRKVESVLRNTFSAGFRTLRITAAAVSGARWRVFAFTTAAEPHGNDADVKTAARMPCWASCAPASSAPVRSSAITRSDIGLVIVLKVVHHLERAVTATRFIAIVALAAWSVLPGQSARRQTEPVYSFRSPRSIQVSNSTPRQKTTFVAARIHRTLRGKSAVPANHHAAPGREFAQILVDSSSQHLVVRSRAVGAWRYTGSQRDRGPPASALLPVIVSQDYTEKACAHCVRRARRGEH